MGNFEFVIQSTFRSAYYAVLIRLMKFLINLFLFPVPCAPVNVSASLVCPNSAHVSWVASSSATAYNVTAVGHDGHIYYCHTTSTSCDIPNMPCGQNYNITVTPYADSCAGNPSSPLHFTGGTQREEELKSKSDVLI